MGFTPTTWTGGGAPGISSDQLNRLELGVTELWAQKRDIVVVTADHTLALVDAGKIVEADSTSAIGITIPPHSAIALPVGAELELVGVNTGLVTIVAGAGVTVHTTSTLVLNTRWSVATIYQRALDEWVLAGDLTPV